MLELNMNEVASFIKRLNTEELVERPCPVRAPGCALRDGLCDNAEGRHEKCYVIKTLGEGFSGDSPAFVRMAIERVLFDRLHHGSEVEREAALSTLLRRKSLISGDGWLELFNFMTTHGHKEIIALARQAMPEECESFPKPSKY